jgi:solute:Na+ symporter, SSS family
LGIAALVAYALIIVAISLRVSRGLRGTQDFLIGDRTLGIWQGVGLLGGIFLAGTAVGVVGQGYSLGLPGAALDLALGLGFAILLVGLLGRLRQRGHASVGALIRDHYGENSGAVAAIAAGGAWLILLAAFIAAAGRALAGLTGWPETTAIVVTLAILLLYAVPGGMRAVAASNLVQLALLCSLLGWTAWAAAGRVSAIPPATRQFDAGYLLAVTFLSAPTTVLAPDVMLGVASVRDNRAARRTLMWVIGALVVGGVGLAWLGSRAARLTTVGDPEKALPALIDLVLPTVAAAAGLAVLFGASLAGAVSELLVCTYILAEEFSRRLGIAAGRSGLRPVRVLMGLAALVATSIAILSPHVVEMVLMAFRIYVPAIVPQAVAALLGLHIAKPWGLASIVAGPVVALALAIALPETELTAIDPVVCGSLIAAGLLVVGRVLDSTNPMSRAPSVRRDNGWQGQA